METTELATDKNSSSPKGSPASDWLNEQKNKVLSPAAPAPTSEKGSDKGEAPPPKSNDSNASSKTPPSPSLSSPPPPSSSPSPTESPSNKSPPPSPSPPPPVTPPASPPPPASSSSPRPTPPSSSPSPPSPQSQSPPPPQSQSPPSPSSSSTPQPSSQRPSSSPTPSSGNGDNPNPSPPKQSPSSPDSQDPSISWTTLNISSSGNLPAPPYNVGGSSPPQTPNTAPPVTQYEQSAVNAVSPTNSSGLSGSSHATSMGSSNNSLPSKPGGGGDSHAGKYVGIAFAGVCVLFIVALCVLVVVIRKKKRGAVHDVSYMPAHMKPGADGNYLEDGNYKNGSQRASGQPLGTPDAAQPKSAQKAFSYESIMGITNGFSSENIIGEGGFGCVYRGWLADGRAVAVKRLKAGSGQGEREFRAEVEIISRVHHRHLVSLVGYCISEQQKILLYEFVPNGTLDHHLHGNGMPVLDWTKRVKIAIGAARGLAYLHEDCNPKIIHRDIKSANILLDDTYVAQVSDFGLARLSDDDNTHVSTRVMGTFGYMAPEYATSGKLTDRSDVFSFGVVLLELLTGRKPVDQTQPLGEESLVEWARPHLIHAVETGDFSKLIDPRLEHQFVESEVLRMIEAAAGCVRHSAPKRPRMLQVVRALDSESGAVDLSNGVKYGQSAVYNSELYDEEIMRFRMMNGFSLGESEFDMQSGDYNSRELSAFRHAWAQDSPGGESESRAFKNSGSKR